MSLTSTITIKNNLRQALTYVNATIVEGGWANGAQPPALIGANTTTGPIILNPATGTWLNFSLFVPLELIKETNRIWVKRYTHI